MGLDEYVTCILVRVSEETDLWIVTTIVVTWELGVMAHGDSDDSAALFVLLVDTIGDANMALADTVT